MLLCTHLHHSSFWYLPTCNAFNACYIRCQKYLIGITRSKKMDAHTLVRFSHSHTKCIAFVHFNLSAISFFPPTHLSFFLPPVHYFSIHQHIIACIAMSSTHCLAGRQSEKNKCIVLPINASLVQPWWLRWKSDDNVQTQLPLTPSGSNPAWDLCMVKK